MPDPQAYIDRMLENENLTGDLKDEAAGWLLDWGAARLKEMAAETPDPETLSQKAAALMKFMHGLNRLAGHPPRADAAALPPLAESYAAAFGTSRAANQAECTEAAARVSEMAPREALEFLINWVAAPDKSE